MKKAEELKGAYSICANINDDINAIMELFEEGELGVSEWVRFGIIISKVKADNDRAAGILLDAVNAEKV